MPIAARGRRGPGQWARRAERKCRKRDFIGAFKCISAAALDGNIEAQFSLADLYRGGIGVPQSLNNAALWLEQAAIGGHLEAMVRLAKLQLVGFAPAKTVFGSKGPPDYETSMKWAERAAAAGLPEGKAILALALEQMQASSQEEILRLLEEAAAAQDPSACLQLAIKLLKGRSKYCDRERIASLLNVAASKNIPQALYILGVAIEVGFGSVRDEKKAYMLYERSASLGLVYGMARHGSALIAGRQSQKNLVVGETWLRKAAFAGHGGAASMIGALRAGQDGYPPNLHQAANWFQKAGDLGDSFGSKAAGLLSYLGYSESSEAKVVLALMRKSRLLTARPASDPASLLVPKGVPFAFTVNASTWFEVKARVGDQKAILGLASCLAFGMDGPPDHQAAMRYLQDNGLPAGSATPEHEPSARS